MRPVRILVDCGWDSQFKEASMARLTEAVLSKEEPIDLILLSFGDLEHVGALPLVVGRLVEFRYQTTPAKLALVVSF